MMDDVDVLEDDVDMSCVVGKQIPTSWRVSQQKEV